MNKHANTGFLANCRDRKDQKNDFPTPPWATRALMSHPLRSDLVNYRSLSCWEPACNRGHMLRPLSEYFGSFLGSDAYDYGCGYPVIDFLDPNREDCLPPAVDWIITNPPFTGAEQFAHRALHLARIGVALLTRTAFLEGGGRHRRLFSKHPPYKIAQFVERVPIFQGQLDPKGSTAASYCWVIWLKEHQGPTKFEWIPPCRKALERASDYEE